MLVVDDDPSVTGAIKAITGHDDPEVEMEGLRAGADDWIANPVDLAILLARLDRLVRRRAGI